MLSINLFKEKIVSVVGVFLYQLFGDHFSKSRTGVESKLNRNFIRVSLVTVNGIKTIRRQQTGDI